MGIKLESLPVETQRQILEMARAQTPIASPPIDDPPPKLVQPGIAIEPNRITIMIAVETKAEVNQRQWKAKNRRAGEAWRRTREAIGPCLGALEPFARHYADGGALRVGFVRLGGRRLDVMSNLGSALKGVEDAVAYLLGASDGSPQWHAVAGQEPGLVGVRVTVEVMG